VTCSSRASCGAPGRDVLRRAEQLAHLVRKALGLEQPCAGDAAAGTDDGVARAGEQLRVGIHRPRAGHQIARETVVQAVEALLAGLAQVQIGEQAPHCDRGARQPGAADAAEAAHESREQDAWHPVGEQEVEVFLLKESAQRGQVHEFVNQGC
jgi:hypothetical protein